MEQVEGTVTEMRIDPSGAVTAVIACPRKVIPAPGQYLAAFDRADPDVSLSTALFPSEYLREGFACAAPVPRSWSLGTVLSLRGPLGTGFDLRGGNQPRRHLAFVGLDGSIARLQPLIMDALQDGLAATLYTGSPIPSLPSALEVYPLSEAPATLEWADMLLIDAPLEALGRLRQIFGLQPGQPLPCEAQALITTAYPCAGTGICGACAVPSPRGWKLACRDGPVFDLGRLEW